MKSGSCCSAARVDLTHTLAQEHLADVGALAEGEHASTAPPSPCPCSDPTCSLCHFVYGRRLSSVLVAQEAPLVARLTALAQVDQPAQPLLLLLLRMPLLTAYCPCLMAFSCLVLAG